MPRHLWSAPFLALFLACASLAIAQESASIRWEFEVGSELWGPLTHQAGTLYFGCDDGRVLALDTATQTTRWEFKTAGRVRSAVLLDGDNALFASDDGLLYAVDISTGVEAWRFELGGGDQERILPSLQPPYSYDYKQSSPVEADGTIYVGSVTGNLFAIDSATGTVRWRFETAGPIRSTPAVHAGRVLVGSWDGHLYAVDAGTGTLDWKYDTGGIVQSSPASAEGKVIIGSRGTKIHALNVASGELIWQHEHEDGSWVESSPVIDGGTVFIGSSDALTLFAFELETGRIIWTHRTQAWSWSTPLVTEDLIYIGGISAEPYYFPGVKLEAGFHAIDCATGERRWSLTPRAIEGYVTGGVFSSPAVDEKTVYVAALDGFLYALER